MVFFCKNKGKCNFKHFIYGNISKEALMFLLKICLSFKINHFRGLFRGNGHVVSHILLQIHGILHSKEILVDDKPNSSLLSLDHLGSAQYLNPYTSHKDSTFHLVQDNNCRCFCLRTPLSCSKKGTNKDQRSIGNQMALWKHRYSKHRMRAWDN